jgi:endonuclease YncB( thermonuclease family)
MNKKIVSLALSLFVLIIMLLSPKGFNKPIFTVQDIKNNSSFTLFKAKVISVHDGDTITVISASYHNKRMKVRIRDLDCFEKQSNFKPVAIRAQKQAHYFNLSLNEVYKRGERARILLLKKLNASNQIVTLAIKNKERRDVYHRFLAYVFIKEENVNNFLIQSKNCFSYRRL